VNFSLDANTVVHLNLISVDSSEYVKEQCNDVCYSLCAKGVDISAAATAA
jgi:hypothetical protein